MTNQDFLPNETATTLISAISAAVGIGIWHSISPLLGILHTIIAISCIFSAHSGKQVKANVSVSVYSNLIYTLILIYLWIF